MKTNKKSLTFVSRELVDFLCKEIWEQGHLGFPLGEQ